MTIKDSIQSKKVSIIGVSASGKTTLAKALSSKLHTPYYDLDDIFWMPNWVKAPQEMVFKRVEEISKTSSWVFAGNYSKVSHLHIWPKADLIVWLDLPLHLLLVRGFKRGLKLYKDKKPICNGNYVTFSKFLGKSAIHWWILRTYLEKKTRYKRLLRSQKYPMIHLKSQKQIDRFLEDISG